MAISKKTAFDALLDAVDWKAVGAPGPGATGDPYTTHEGILKLPMLNIEIQVYQLSNGQRIIPTAEMEKIFCAMGVDSDRCSNSTYGIRCQLPKGHEGGHRAKTADDGTVEW